MYKIQKIEEKIVLRTPLLIYYRHHFEASKTSNLNNYNHINLKSYDNKNKQS